MTETEARCLITDYYLSESHTEDDKFMFVEALRFLIDEYHNPNDMHNLAWFHAEEKDFRLYQKYLEMAAEYGYRPSYESLGYLWYYGQTGTVDYEKAFRYFSMGAESCDDHLRIGCEYKIADMYRFGYFVEKDEEKYVEIIERLYEECSHPEDLFSLIPPEFLPWPALNYRMAGILESEGNITEALHLLGEARTGFAEYLRSNPSWWGNIEEMEKVVLMMHRLSPSTDGLSDLYDLFWLSEKECCLTFRYRGIPCTVECIAEDGKMVIRFNNRWYRSISDFFEKAKIGGRPVTALFGELIEYQVS